jgi:hypothetical protein
VKRKTLVLRSYVSCGIIVAEGEGGFLPITPQEGEMKAYCFKCKKQQEMKSPEEVTLKNGRKAVKGTCAVCGGKTMRMGGKK